MSISFVKNFDDLAESIATPNPSRPIENAVGNFGRLACDAISARPDLYAPTILQSPLRAACQPYWDSQGYDGPVEAQPEFLGGQCFGTLYNVVRLATFTNGGQFEDGTFSVYGPIRGRRIVALGEFSTRWEVDAADANGTETTFTRTNGVSPTGASWGATTAVDGPDDCGNLEPEIPFIPGANPAPDPGPLPPGTGPQINIRGNPVLVLPPTLEISPGLNVELPIGEINLGSGIASTAAQPPISGGELPGGDGSGGPDGGGPGAGGDSDFGEPPPGERWCGVCVKINVQPVGAGSIPQAEPQSIYPRTIGNVRLKFAADVAIAEYDTPIVNRQKSTCVWEPVRGLNPVGVRVNLLPGYTFTYTPYSVPLEN